MLVGTTNLNRQMSLALRLSGSSLCSGCCSKIARGCLYASSMSSYCAIAVSAKRRSNSDKKTGLVLMDPTLTRGGCVSIGSDLHIRRIGESFGDPLTAAGVCGIVNDMRPLTGFGHGPSAARPLPTLLLYKPYHQNIQRP